jgi:hypothetical protein
MMTALAKDKKGRYPSAGAFGQKLRSLRYSLETTSGDPATELAKIIDSTEAVERESKQMIVPSKPSGGFDFDPSEATVIRIRTADAFNSRDNDASIVRARAVIDRFEEEETRLAQLSGDQLRILRSHDGDEKRSRNDSVLPPPRARRDSEEPTRAAAPLMPLEPTSEDIPTYEGSAETPSDATKLIAPRERRTPSPQKAVQLRSPAAPPPMPPRTRGPTPGPPVPLPGIMPAPAMAPMPQPPRDLGISGGPALPFSPSPPAASYPAWGAPITAQRPPREATPTARDAFDRPMAPNRPSMPQVAGFGTQKKKGLAPWMLIVGALVMAALAFAITRAFIH